MKCLKLSLLLILSYALLASHQFSDNSEILWRQGKAAASNGNIEEALHIWETARKTNNASAPPDPRIGIDYIKLATSHKKLSYYKEASAMFMWGISGRCNESYREELVLELERIKPILKPEDYRTFKKNSRKDLSALCSGMVKVWRQLDPTISTEYNERLIEHWERIAYAKKHFTRNSSTVYDSDDRALIYVRLGEPDYKRSNAMRYNRTQVRSWVYDAIDYQARGGVSAGGSSGGDSTSAFSQRGGDGVSQAMYNDRKRFDVADRFSREAEQIHRLREYDIWVYIRENHGSDENLVYIFGERGDTGFYEMLNSLEDMIPDRAFRNGGIQGTIISPGYLLQLLFYQQVLTVDDYFAEAFSELESRLVSVNGLNKSTAFIARSKNINNLDFIQVQAPQEKSTYIEKISGIDLVANQYRLLDENNKPILATFIEGKPQKAFVFDRLKSQNYENRDYQLYFYTKSNDSNYNIVDIQSQTSSIYLEEEGKLDEMEPSYGFFEIPQLQNSLIEQVFTVELLNLVKDSQEISDYGFSTEIRAIGKLNEKQPRPLSSDPKLLQMSDIMVGSSDIPTNKHESGPTNFKVLHDRKIPQNRNLMFHFEIYNLNPKNSGPNKFRVEYQLKPENRNIFKRIFNSGDKTGLTLNFETSNTYYKSDIEVMTSSFETGDYLLELKVIEPSTGRQISRKVTIEIVDKDS